MRGSKLAFLQAVVGEASAQTLAKAIERAPELGSAICPRAILSWLHTTETFESYVPGTESKLCLEKSENKYSGYVTVGHEVINLVKADIYQVAGAVALTLGLEKDPIQPKASPALLSRLGKQLDLLVKSQCLRKAIPGIKPPKMEGFGGPAAPKPPVAPTPPTATQPKIKAPNGLNPTSTGAATTPELPKTPGLKLPKLPKV